MSLSRGGVSVQGCLCPGGGSLSRRVVSVQGVPVQGISVRRGSLFRRVSVQGSRSLSRGWVYVEEGGLCLRGPCPRGSLSEGGLWPDGGLCPEGLCPGVLVSVQGGLCPGGGISVEKGVLCPGGPCPRGSLSEGFSLPDGVLWPEGVCQGETPVR